MLSSRVSAIRAAARQLSTKTEVSGVKVVARDSDSPVSKVAVVVRAGSRYSPQIGASQALKNFAFNTRTSTKSGLRRYRESELTSGVYGASVSRENIQLSAEFLRPGLPFYVDSIADVVANTLYKQYEFDEQVLPQSISEAKRFNSDATALALENAHQIAFRRGLGNPLYVQEYSPLTRDNVETFAREAYTKANITVYGSGVNVDDLVDLVDSKFKKLPSGSSLTSPKTHLFGGESRTSSASGNAVVIAFPLSASPANAVLANALGGSGSAVKWSLGQSPLALAGLKTGSTIKAAVSSYSDADLLHITITGSSAAAVKAGAKEAVHALKEVHGISEELVKRAVAQTKFADAARSESDFVYSLAAEAVDFGAVNVAAVQKSAEQALKSKAALSVVGNVAELPYLDELF
ncbi:cytochrome b-c1 complex subunit 2, mitochondrial [Trichomonascus vanleenenianus]|uniref:ubiquinol--cytochrome-c reductase subunit 2 n=1 Tax=Trichomonascus vanleenenianus TaxID=2268995 RepID=UPI003EC9538F